MHLNQSSSSNNFSGNFDDNQLLFIIHHTIQYNAMQRNTIQILRIWCVDVLKYRLFI